MPSLGQWHGHDAPMHSRWAHQAIGASAAETPATNQGGRAAATAAVKAAREVISLAMELTGSTHAYMFRDLCLK